MNYFIEGLQGAGKTTLLRDLSKKYPESHPFYEGDLSPLVPAWCAYCFKEEYEAIRKKYPLLKKEIKQKTECIVSHSPRGQSFPTHILAYTQILTDILGFHQDLERFQWYQGNREYSLFEGFLLDRFARWNGKNQFFEATFFQNIIETLLLFYQRSEDEILCFYEKIKDCFNKKEYYILYLDVKDLEERIEQIKKERVDLNGNELWYPLVIEYFKKAPYAKERGLSTHCDFLNHLKTRNRIEKRILKEIFKKESILIDRRKKKEEF